MSRALVALTVRGRFGWLMPQRRLPSHLWIAASGWTSRILTAAIQLVSVRFLLEGLGVERYAVFALLTGLQGWYLLSDLGVGVSVQNHVSEARALGHPPDAVLRAGRLLAAALLTLTIFALWFAAPFFAPLILRSFNFLSPIERVRLFVLTSVLSIGIGIGSLVYKIWYAERRGYLANLTPALGAALGLAGIVVTCWLPADVRLESSLIAFLAPNAALPLLVLTRQIVSTRLAPTSGALPFRSILQRAVGFWAFALMATLTLQVDYIVLSQFLTASDITAYALGTKIFGLTFFIYNAVLMALWPVFAELVAARRWPDVVAHVQRALVAGLTYMGICIVAMIWVMPAAMRLLAPNQMVTLPTRLVLALGFYQLVRVWCDTFSTLLQSMSWLRPFWILVPAQALLSVLLQWWLTPRYGLIGLVGGLTVSFVLTVAWGLPLAVKMRAHRDSATA